MISKFSEMLKYAEDYLSSRPYIADLIVDKYEICNIYNIGNKSIGAAGVGETMTLDVKIKGTFDSDWQYIYTMEIEHFYGICIKGQGSKRIR